MNGETSATAMVGALMVKPAPALDTPKIRLSSGSRGWVEYRFRKAHRPANPSATSPQAGTAGVAAGDDAGCSDPGPVAG
jgi:hypothetical protein